MNPIKICFFGKFQILKNGEDVLKKIRTSKKKMQLLEYLIINSKRSIPPYDLSEILWQENEDVDFDNSLKTLVSRLRKDLAEFELEHAIVRSGNSYSWNTAIPCNIDVFEMEEAAKVVLNAEKLTSENKIQFENVLSLYTGDFLSETNNHSWVMPKSLYYHNLYLKIVQKYIYLLREEKKYDEVIHVSQLALAIDGLDSVMNLELMWALLKINKKKEAMRHYKNLSKQYMIQYGAKPTDEILGFYKELVKGERRSEADIEKIFNELQNEQAEEKGAYVCEYALFKEIYNIQVRNLKRFNTMVFLVLAEIYSPDDAVISDQALETSMQVLLATLQSNLRKGDVIAQYSSSQYILLLPAITDYITAQIPMERVRSDFYRHRTNTKILFAYRLMPAEEG